MAARERRIAREGNKFNAKLYNAACAGNDAVAASSLRDERIDVNGRDDDGCSAIFSAVVHGHVSIVAKFIDCERVDLNAATNKGATPLFAAAVQGHGSIVAKFIECQRVDLNAADSKEFTPIMMAAAKDNHSVVDQLAEAGAILSINHSVYSLHDAVYYDEASPEKIAAGFAVLKKHGVTSDNVPVGFQSKYYFQDGQGRLYKRNVTEQIWINRKDLLLCLNYTFNWSVANQIDEQVHRTLPSDLIGAGHFVAHCFFDVGGGELGNGIARLIMQYYGGFDASKSPFALRGRPEYGKLPDNAHRCCNCLEEKESKALRACASCDRVCFAIAVRIVRWQIGRGTSAIASFGRKRRRRRQEEESENENICWR
jgi:hypothetical protein